MSTDAIVESLRALLPTERRPLVRQRVTLLDTFDGRIRRAGARLTRSGAGSAVTIGFRSESAPFSVSVSTPPGFVWDLPDGPLRHALLAVAGGRRLVAQAEVDAQESVLDVRDHRDKTVARLTVESGRARLPAERARWEPVPSVITLTGLRGYEDAYTTLLPVIESRPGLGVCPEGFDSAILRHLGILTTDVPPPGSDLPPTALAGIGIRQIHRALRQILVANEPGVRDALDTEFLHDYRVAVRRTRSLLKQIRQVFPAAAVEHFSNEFAWLGRLTGPARDLDVLLFSIRTNQQELQPDDVEGLAAFLSEAGQREHRRLIETLDSDRYRQLLAGWETFLLQPVNLDQDVSNAGRFLVDVVSPRAWRLSRRIARGLGAVDDHTPAERLHALRIDAKKLRYLVDVTPSFYDAADLERVLGALKKLQRVLGDFNDAQLQEQRLLALRMALTDDEESRRTRNVLERLATRYRQRSKDLRRRIADGITRFRSKDTRAACRRAFKRATAMERAL